MFYFHRKPWGNDTIWWEANKKYTPWKSSAGTQTSGGLVQMIFLFTQLFFQVPFSFPGCRFMEVSMNESWVAWVPTHDMMWANQPLFFRPCLHAWWIWIIKVSPFFSINSSPWTIPTGIPGIPYIFSMNPFPSGPFGMFSSAHCTHPAGASGKTPASWRIVKIQVTILRGELIDRDMFFWRCHLPCNLMDLKTSDMR